jgi:hypothetical protein
MRGKTTLINALLGRVTLDHCGAAAIREVIVTMTMRLRGRACGRG